MELLLRRIAKKDGYTIGKLYVLSEERRVKSEESNGEEKAKIAYDYFCDTLEPTWRNLLGIELPKSLESKRLGRLSGKKAYKIKGKTAIPEGKYPLVITKSYKFRAWLPLLVGVPGFQGIRIHAGNSAKDTEGCILLGMNKKVGMGVDSRIWLHRFINKFVEARERDESVFITIE